MKSQGACRVSVSREMAKIGEEAAQRPDGSIDLGAEQKLNLYDQVDMNLEGP
jgi:hypothetical protein